MTSICIFQYRKQRISRLSILEDILIVFLYVFGLVLPIIHSSSILLLIILPIRLLFTKGSLKQLSHFLINRYIFTLIAIYISLIILTICNTTLNLEFDFTLIKTLINGIIHIVIAAMIVILFYRKNRTINYVLEILLAIFCIQSLIQVFAFFSPTVLQFVQFFQSSSTVERAELFSGRRGLALSGTVFFGLASIYGLIFFIFFKDIIIKKQFNLKEILIFLILVVGGFFTGRTYFIGLGIALMYFVSSNIPSKIKIKFFVRIIIFIGVLIIILLGIIPQDIYDKLNNLFLYVFEAAYNFINTGHASTTSSEHLLDDMYFPISLKTFFLGDGRYTGLSGEYYMSTDAGYMRNILLFGIGGLILTIYFDYKLFWGYKRLRKKDLSKFSSFIFIYLAIIHIKGEVFAYLITLHSILFIIYFFIMITGKKTFYHS